MPMVLYKSNLLAHKERNTMNETETQKMLKAAQTYIKYLETKEQELLSKVHQYAVMIGKLDKEKAMLVKKIDKLEEANTILANSNEDLARKLTYFRACNNNQANMILQLQKEYNAY